MAALQFVVGAFRGLKACGEGNDDEELGSLQAVGAKLKSGQVGFYYCETHLKVSTMMHATMSPNSTQPRQMI